MLDNETIDTLTREAKPRDFRMLRSYVARAATAQYVRRVMIPSLRHSIRRSGGEWTANDQSPATKL